MTPTPLCPTCGYDLSATPDGLCPECGTAFSLEQLAAHDAVRRQRQSRRAQVARWALSMLAVPPTAVILTFAIAEKAAGDAAEASAMLLVFLWVLACLEVLALGRNTRTMSCVPPLCVVGGLSVLPGFWNTPLGPPILTVILATASWAARSRGGRRAKLFVAMLLAVPVMVVSGIAWTLHSAIRWKQGYRATEFSWWSETWYAPHQYAVSAEQGAAAGCGMLVFGVVLLALAASQRNGHKRALRANTTPGDPAARSHSVTS